MARKSVKSFLEDWELYAEGTSCVLAFLAGVAALVVPIAPQRAVLGGIGLGVSGGSAVVFREYRERRGRAKRNKTFRGEGEAFEQILQHAVTHETKRVILLQYSGTQVNRIIRAILLKHGVTVELFIQHQENAEAIRSERQVDLIKSSTKNLVKLNETVPSSSTFKIYKFKVPVSTRAILIDDKVLCVGNYTFEAKDRSGKREYANDPVTIAGMDRPTRLVWHGTEEFEFYREMIESLAASYRDDPNTEKVPM